MEQGAGVLRDTNGIQMKLKDKRKNLKITEELWLRIKAAAKQNNRKIIQELDERFR